MTWRYKLRQSIPVKTLLYVTWCIVSRSDEEFLEKQRQVAKVTGSLCEATVDFRVNSKLFHEL